MLKVLVVTNTDAPAGTPRSVRKTRVPCMAIPTSPNPRDGSRNLIEAAAGDARPHHGWGATRIGDTRKAGGVGPNISDAESHGVQVRRGADGVWHIREFDGVRRHKPALNRGRAGIERRGGPINRGMPGSSTSSRASVRLPEISLLVRFVFKLSRIVETRCCPGIPPVQTTTVSPTISVSPSWRISGGHPRLTYIQRLCGNGRYENKEQAKKANAHVGNQTILVVRLTGGSHTDLIGECVL